MKDTDTFTVTSKIGKFYFPKETLLSHAKQVRDAVTGQWLSPHDRQMELYSVEDAYKFMAQADSTLLRNVSFELELYPEYETASLLYKAGKLHSHFGDAFHAFDLLNAVARKVTADILLGRMNPMVPA